MGGDEGDKKKRNYLARAAYGIHMKFARPTPAVRPPFAHTTLLCDILVDRLSQLWLKLTGACAQRAMIQPNISPSARLRHIYCVIERGFDLPQLRTLISLISWT